MTGYEKSPDYGNPPPPTWQQWVKLALVIGALVAFVALIVIKQASVS